ncbi:Glycosyl transferase, family 2 [Candidatus Magnetomorum sp. HK-1]|nr:Glycosyl transferase, family 2 [Candidatus Magnetomorum sp. HK-1]
MKIKNPNLSIILSFRNEADVLEEFISRVQKVLAPLSYTYEMVFVNDASTDASHEILKQKAALDNRIKVISMSRRFGQAECVFAGFEKSSGDRVLYMDADLQDPPEIIPELMRTFDREKADVVYTTRLSRSGENFGKLLLTRMAYRIVHALSSVDIPVDSGDFKLLSRQVVNHLIDLKEQGLYVRGLVSWLGFKQIPFYYHREARFSGKSKFPIWKSSGPFISFIRAIISFSMFPIYSVLLTGFILFNASLCILFAFLGMTFFYNINIPSQGYTIAAITSIGGLQLIAIGMVGLYVGHIHQNTMGRPRYIIESTINLNEIS